LDASGSKQALLVEMLSKHQGTTLDAWAKATGWLSHTTRAALVFGGSLLLFGPKVIEHGDDQIGHDDGEGDFEDEHGRLFLIEALALRYGLRLDPPLESSCKRSMALVVLIDFPWLSGKRAKVSNRSPASSGP
jgi:hypothetical protein